MAGVHEMAHQRAAKHLLKRTGSVSSAYSHDHHSKHGDHVMHPRSHDHHHLRRRGYAGSVSTMSHADNPDDDVIATSRLPTYENTYRLEPSEKFPVTKIRRMLREVLSQHLTEQDYDGDLCKKMTRALSDTVKSRAKELVGARYKVVCLIHIGQRGHQGVRVGSRCLWNCNFDNFASAHFTNSSVFAVASVYGVYYD